MLLRINSDICPNDIKVGDVIQFTRDGNRLFYRGNEVIKGIPAVMQMETYNAIVTEIGIMQIEVSVARYADLHRHSDNSLLDGTSKVVDMVKRSVPEGALTDHGNMYGFLEFYKEMRANNKKPIIGMEAYVGTEEKLAGHHLILLAKNNTGYQNLKKMASLSWNNTYRGKPHILISELEQNSEGLICTTACIGSPFGRMINDGEVEAAEQLMLKFLDLFGEDFYLEIQRHGIQGEDVVEAVYKRWRDQYGCKIIATTDSHYTDKEDAGAHEIALCLQTQKLISEPHMKFDGEGYHIHTSEEMEDRFSDIPEALETTLEIASKCNVELDLGKVNLPVYKFPEGYTAMEYFSKLCHEGHESRFAGSYKHDDKRYRERFQYEIEMIERMGFATYFIVVWDFVNYARSNNIYVGPGRGSAAGSLLAYCIGITDIDPIEYNLLFERFLNPERVSWPDVDLDFEHSRRGEVIEYIRNKYGVDKVSQIITFGTLAPKMAVKDVGRVLGFPAGFTQNLAKMIPDEPKMTIAKALDMNPELNERYKNDPDVEYIIDVAKKLEGCKRHSSQHACGILIGPQPLYNFFPTAMVVDEETGVPSVTSQVQCYEAEELSILKMDLLGLKNLSVIHESIDNIVKKTGEPLDYHDIPLNDRAVYKFLSQRNTGGVFQLESEGMTKVIAGMFTDIDEIPEEEMNQCFERLVAAVALYRPGPMAYIDDYIKGMKDSSKIHYDHPSLEPILKSTYGIIVYQEQVMQITRSLAGYTMGRADLVRKAMGKKKQKVMDAEKIVFIHGNKEAYESGKDANYAPGCIANGISEETATIIWNKMADFAKYAFNRSHAVCYAYISAITAWLSYYHPVEFYTAMLNAFRLQSDKTKTYLAQIYHRDIKILPPDINRSATVYSVEDGSIRFGLSGIKGVNKFMDNVIKERNDNGEFHSFQDFMERMDRVGHPIGKKEIEGLVYSGALDCFDLTKSSMLSFYEVFSKDLAKNKKRLEGQCSIFDMEQFSELAVIDIPRIPEFKKRELMEKEQEMLGIYLSGHPVDIYEQMMVNDGKMLSISDCISSINEGNITTVGMIKDFRKVWTKKEEEMLLFRVENRLDNIPCVIFPREAARLKTCVQEGKIVILYGKLVENEDYGKQIIVNNVIPESEVLEKMMSQKFMARIYVPIMNKEQQTKLLDIVKKFKTKSGGTVIGLQMLAKGQLYPSRPYQLRHSNAVIEAVSIAFPGTKIEY